MCAAVTAARPCRHSYASPGMYTQHWQAPAAVPPPVGPSLLPLPQQQTRVSSVTMPVGAAREAKYVQPVLSPSLLPPQGMAPGGFSQQQPRVLSGRGHESPLQRPEWSSATPPSSHLTAVGVLAGSRPTSVQQLQHTPQQPQQLVRPTPMSPVQRAPEVRGAVGSSAQPTRFAPTNPFAQRVAAASQGYPAEPPSRAVGSRPQEVPVSRARRSTTTGPVRGGESSRCATPPPSLATFGQENYKADMKHLLMLLNNPRILQRYAISEFQRSDIDGDGVLSFAELEGAIRRLHRELGLRSVREVDDHHHLVRRRMHRFDIDRSGFLNETEFAELYKWTLWRKYEDLEPPTFKRGELVGHVRPGIPSQAYSIGERLGKGQFGVVNRVRHRQTGVDRAMKTVSKSKAVSSKTPIAELHKEIELLALLDHPHILRLFEHYADGLNVYVIMDVLQGGELHDIVKQHADAERPLPEAWISHVFSQVLEAIAYCHGKGVMHKDLKFEHVMFQRPVNVDSPLEDVHAIVIDVGLAELFGPQHGKAKRSKVVSGSLCTMAPEVLMQDYSYKCDIWSLGCMLYAIFNVVPAYLPDGRGGKVLYTYPFAPVPTKTDAMGIEGLLKAQRAGPPMEKIRHASLSSRLVIERMLAFYEMTRPSARDCLTMPWFKEGPSSKRVVKLSKEQVRSLEQHREHQMWWSAVSSHAATQLPASRLASLSARFDAMSKSHGGHLSRRDLAQFLEQMGMSREASQRTADAADYDHDEEIEWSEFVAAMLPTSHELFGISLQSAFQSLDTNCDGELSRQEVMQLLSQGHIDGLHMPAAKTADTMIEELDKDHTGSVSYDEFLHYFINAEQGDFVD